MFHEGGHIAGQRGYRYAGSRRHHHHKPEPAPAAPRVFGFIAEPLPPRRDHCKYYPRSDEPFIVEGRSNEHHSKSAAFEDAQRDWRGGVRFKFGEAHTDLANAQFLRHQCVQSSVNQTLTGRVGEATGLGILYRCSFWAQPCEAPMEYGSERK